VQLLGDVRDDRIEAEPEGLDACEVVEKLYKRQLGSIEAVGGVASDDLKGLNKSLMRLERFWTDQIRYRL
jgi:hypothetical protein